jgi:hypothetical protein
VGGGGGGWRGGGVFPRSVTFCCHSPFLQDQGREVGHALPRGVRCCNIDSGATEGTFLYSFSHLIGVIIGAVSGL